MKHQSQNNAIIGQYHTNNAAKHNRTLHVNRSHRSTGLICAVRLASPSIRSHLFVPLWYLWPLSTIAFSRTLPVPLSLRSRPTLPTNIRLLLKLTHLGLHANFITYYLLYTIKECKSQCYAILMLYFKEIKENCA
jgi:hypothetical protein